MPRGWIWLAGMAWLAAARAWGGAGLREEDRQAVTADGWRIALHRYQPERLRFAEPVLLTHGFIENRRIWDLDPRRSLARRLAEAGFDVWTMEARGSGESQSPSPTDPTGWRFSIEDFYRLDAPAAIAAVLEASGAPQLLMVGHSMGGLVTYAILEGELAGSVRAAVTLAGAGTMSGGSDLAAAFNKFFKLLGLTLGPVLPADAPFPAGWALHQALGDDDAAWAALAGRLASPLGEPFWHAPDMTPESTEALLRRAVTNTGLNVVRRFLDYAREGRVAGVTERLPLIRTPVLALAGSEDQVIPARDVRAVAALCRARYVELAGVGHEDIVVGERAPSAVYPLVVRWLSRRATRLRDFDARTSRAFETAWRELRRDGAAAAEPP